MDIQQINSDHQRVLRQRNMLLMTTVAAFSLGVVGLLAAVSGDKQLVLQPVLRTPLTVSSASLSREYLEAVIRG